jgi:Asp-tRNA(Asn)/Glu-tRNA(Gln) amidotransferase A subunit family amidase
MALLNLVYRDQLFLRRAYALTFDALLAGLGERPAFDQVNPKVNAIVSTVDRGAALGMAKQADADLQAGKPVGKLHGLPWAIKDTDDAKGLPTTLGSPIFKNHIAKEDSLQTGRIRAAGGLIIGTTNLPEFGAGSHTFNKVFGVTRNPYNLALSAGGSSGGAAVAIATGMLPMADGNDTGGSLRNPASWTIGRVPAM